MTNIIVFMILWLPNKNLPQAAFLQSFQSVEQCERVKANVQDKEMKKHLSCIQVVGALPDAGESL